jgi:hypothetical protein
MTTDRDALVEKMAIALYEKARLEFHADPATISCGVDFADDVFPPWEEMDAKEKWRSDVFAVLDIAMEEVARAAKEYQHPNMALYNHQTGIAAALRAYKCKP